MTRQRKTLFPLIVVHNICEEGHKIYQLKHCEQQKGVLIDLLMPMILLKAINHISSQHIYIYIYV